MIGFLLKHHRRRIDIFTGHLPDPATESAPPYGI